MSDTSGGQGQGSTPPPGWWQASDGNWYPPEQHPSAAPPPPPPQQAPPPPHQQQHYAYAPAAPQAAPSNGLAVAALVVGIASIVLFWAFGLGAVLGVVAVVLGFLGMKKADELPGRTGRGQAIAGMITGFIGILAGAVILLGLMAIGSVVDDELDRIGEELESEGFGDINSDPADGVCDEDRFLQDPDC